MLEIEPPNFKKLFLAVDLDETRDIRWGLDAAFDGSNFRYASLAYTLTHVLAERIAAEPAWARDEILSQTVGCLMGHLTVLTRFSDKPPVENES